MRDGTGPGPVTADGFTGFRAAAEEVLDAIAVLDQFHAVRLVGQALDGCRRQVRQGHLRSPQPADHGRFIDSLSSGEPAGLIADRRLGRTQKRTAA